MTPIYVTRAGVACASIRAAVALSQPKTTLPAPLKPVPAVLAKIMQHPIKRPGK